MATKFKKNSKFSKSRFCRTKFDDKIIKNLDFESGLISKNIKSLKFTNFAVDATDEVYNYVLNYYIQYLNGDYSFVNTDFNMDEGGGMRISDRTLRLLSIINDIQCKKYSKEDCKYILKMNSVKLPSLHFYFKKSRNNLKLVLIDLHHLGIYGTRYIDGKAKPISIDRWYRHHQHNECDLADIKSLSDELVPN